MCFQSCLVPAVRGVGWLGFANGARWCAHALGFVCPGCVENGCIFSGTCWVGAAPSCRSQVGFHCRCKTCPVIGGAEQIDPGGKLLSRRLWREARSSCCFGHTVCHHHQPVLAQRWLRIGGEAGCRLRTVSGFRRRTWPVCAILLGQGRGVFLRLVLQAGGSLAEIICHANLDAAGNLGWFFE